MNEQYGLLKKLCIRTVNEEMSGFKTFVFEDGHNIQYKAGQYLTFVHNQNQQEVRRSYSITSSPVLQEPLTIGVKRIENGMFSRQLIDHAKPGDELWTTGSGGLFILPEVMQLYQQLFFFAAGSGITPIYSLIKTALYAHPQVSLVLIYSNTSPERALFLTPLQQLQQQFAGRFHLELLFSNSFNLMRAHLHRNLIFEFLDQYAVAQKDNVLFYICGPENYMRLCTYTLQELGIDANNIKKENFIIYARPKQDKAPPDKEDHQARIHFGNRTYNIPVNYPDSILKAAKKTGLLLPYSCEAGRCGNCVARCTKGTVWHSFNEVLTERELQQGLVLTCVGHPVHGNVELEL